MDTKDRLSQYKQKFLDYMANTRQTCPTWLYRQGAHINRFYSYMDINYIDNLNKITKEQTDKFQHYLYDKYLLSKNTVRCYVITLKSFFNYLYLNGLISANPNPSLISRQLEKKRIRYYNWRELVFRYKKDHYRNKYTPSNLKQKLCSINLFIKYLAGLDIKSIYKIAPEHIQGFKQYLNTNYTNQSTKLQHIRQSCKFLKFFYYKGYTEEDPSKGIEYTGLEDNPKPEPKKETQTELDILMRKYISYRDGIGYRRDKYISSAKPFMEFMRKNGIDNPADATKEHMLKFQNWVSAIKKKDGADYSKSTIQKFLLAGTGFYKFLLKYDIITKDPTRVIELPKGTNSLPRVVMNSKEALKLLNTPDTGTILGIRDRAVLEVFYSTGMRANELSHLKQEDIDIEDGLVKVMYPKGGPSFQRVIAIGKIACYWVKKYLTYVRPVLNPDSPYLFLSVKGNRLSGCILNEITKQYLQKARIRKHITSHSWRVTCATLMLKNGADIRYVQEQLGHHRIQSTQRYTRLVPKDLKRIHAKYHPREKGD